MTRSVWAHPGIERVFHRLLGVVDDDDRAEVAVRLQAIQAADDAHQRAAVAFDGEALTCESSTTLSLRTGQQRQARRA